MEQEINRRTKANSGKKYGDSHKRYGVNEIHVEENIQLTGGDESYEVRRSTQGNAPLITDIARDSVDNTVMRHDSIERTKLDLEADLDHGIHSQKEMKKLITTNRSSPNDYDDKLPIYNSTPQSKLKADLHERITTSINQNANKFLKRSLLIMPERPVPPSAQTQSRVHPAT